MLGNQLGLWKQVFIACKPLLADAIVKLAYVIPAVAAHASVCITVSICASFKTHNEAVPCRNLIGSPATTAAVANVFTATAAEQVVPARAACPGRKA